MVKKRIVSLIILLLLINLAFAQQVVEVQKPVEEKGGLWASIKSVLVSPLFWGIIILFLFICAVLVGLFFLIRWLLQFFKAEKDIYYLLKMDRWKTAKAHKRYSKSNHWYRVEKNIPIKLLKEVDGKVILSNPIAYYRGDCTTHEGNIFIACHMKERSKYFLLPDNDMIVIPSYNEIDVVYKDKKGVERRETIKNIPLAKDIVQFNENEVIIKAESLSKTYQFFIPVIKDDDGKIIDLSVPTFTAIKKLMVEELLYSQSSEFVHLTRKAVDMNPQIRGAEKVNDINKSTEVQTDNQP